MAFPSSFGPLCETLVVPNEPKASDGADAGAIRLELVEILDLLNELPPDNLSERSQVRSRQDELRRRLREIEIPGAAEIASRWAKSDSRKSNLEEIVFVTPTVGDSSGSA